MITDVIKIRLEELLEERGITLYRLAKDTGVSYGNLLNLKSGKAQRIYFDTLDRICESLNCDPSELLSRVPPSEASKD